MEHETSMALCSQNEMDHLIASAKISNYAGLSVVDQLIRSYPADPRLLFFRGSILASLEQYDEAQVSMRAALTCAPDYAIARFQLGFLELTSGQAQAAIASWRPLHALSPDNPLRSFATGLEHLIRDEFEAAIEQLEAGIARNLETPPLNGDMSLIVEKTRELLGSKSAGDEPVSAAHLLLRQYAAKPTKH